MEIDDEDTSATHDRGSDGDRNFNDTEVGVLAMKKGESQGAPGTATKPYMVAATIYYGELRTCSVEVHLYRVGLIGSLSRVLPILAKPPPLMVASFPWDGESDSRTGKSSERETVAGDKEAKAMKVLKQDDNDLQASMMRTTTPCILGCSRGMRSTFWKMTHGGAPLGQHCVSDLDFITPCLGLWYGFFGEVQYAATYGQEQFYWILGNGL